MSEKNPRDKEEWDEFNRKNREFSKKLTQILSTYHDIDDVSFKNSLVDKSQEELKLMLNSMRSERKFYKKILQESHYTEHPKKKKTVRYEEALRKYNSVNSKGKIVTQLITP